jgi:hypothetical protein
MVFENESKVRIFSDFPSYISYINHFDIANANIRRHLLWWVIGMVQQGGIFRQVGAALGVHHTVFTTAWEGYRLYGTPARRHAGGRQRATTPAQDRLLVIQAHRARFSTATSLRNDLANAAESVFQRRRYVEGCMKVICGRKDLTYVSP